MVKANGLKFEEISVSKIIPNPKNPRIDLKPDMPLYQKLRKSIEEFDYSEPIVVNKEKDGKYMIISGHQRFQVMKDLAEEKGEKITKVSVIVKEYDEQHRDALTIALNKITGLWDQEKLAQLFDDMDEEMKQFTGFDEFEIEGILSTPQDLDGLFEDNISDGEGGHDKKGKMITCPHCGKEFEV